METLVKILQQKYRLWSFVPGDRAQWSPRSKKITYRQSERPEDLWSVLHEVGHALLEHTSYESDVQLLQKEVAAWEQACKIMGEFGIEIDQAYIQSCLDSYRDWLHKRSTCPNCGWHGLEHTDSSYSCHNCSIGWTVTPQRLCRPYRLKSAPKTKKLAF